MSRDQSLLARKGKYEDDETGTAYWAKDLEVEKEFDEAMMKISDRLHELSGDCPLQLSGPPAPTWPEVCVLAPPIPTPAGLEEALLMPPDSIPMKAANSGESEEAATPAPPAVIGRTRFFARIRSALLATRRQVETLLIEVHPQGQLDEDIGKRYLPPRCRRQLEEAFEAGASSLAEEVYGAFMYAASKHTAAAQLAEKFQALLSKEQFERKEEKKVFERKRADLKSELASERAKQDHHQPCRRMLLMAHDRIDGLEGFKHKYDQLKVSFDKKVEEMNAMQKKLTSQSLSQTKVFMDDIKSLREQLAQLQIEHAALEKEYEAERAGRQAAEAKVASMEAEFVSMQNRVATMTRAMETAALELARVRELSEDLARKNARLEEDLADPQARINQLSEQLAKAASSAASAESLERDLKAWVEEDAVKDVNGWLDGLKSKGGPDAYDEWQHGSFGLGKMLLWLWGPEGGDKRALREWLELQIPPNSLPRFNRRAWLDSQPRPEPAAETLNADVFLLAAAKKREEEEAATAGWARGHLHHVPARFRRLVKWAKPAELMGEAETMHLIEDVYTKKHAADAQDDAEQHKRQTLPEFVFEYMLDQHGEERLAYKNLSLLLHSLHKMSSVKATTVRVGLFVRFLGLHPKPLSLSALSHYLSVVHAFQNASPAPTSGRAGGTLLEWATIARGVETLAEPTKTHSLQAFEKAVKSNKLRPSRAGPHPGKFDMDEATVVLMDAWEEQMYRPEVVMKAAFKRFDENGDGVLNSKEFTDLVVNFDPKCTDRAALRMFRDALDLAAEKGLTGGTLTPEVFVEIAYKHKLMGNLNEAALADLAQIWEVKSGEMRAWLDDARQRCHPNFPSVFAELERALASLHTSMHQSEDVAANRRLLDQVAALFHDQGDLVDAALREPAVVASPARRLSTGSLDGPEMRDSSCQTHLGNEDVGEVFEIDPEVEEEEIQEPLRVDRPDMYDKEVTAFVRPRRDEADMIGVLEDEVDELRHLLNFAMHSNSMYMRSMDELREEIADAYRLAEESRAEVEHCLRFIEKQQLQQASTLHQPPNWLRELERQIQQMHAAGGDGHGAHPAAGSHQRADLGGFRIPSVMQNTETQTTPRTTDTPRRVEREKAFEARVRAEWAARDQEWAVKRKEMNEIKAAWDLALVWWSHASTAMRAIHNLKEDAQALSAHLLDAATMATGEMGVVRRSRAHPAHRPQPGLPSVQDSFDLAAYVPTAGGDEDYEFTRLAIVHASETGGSRPGSQSPSRSSKANGNAPHQHALPTFLQGQLQRMLDATAQLSEVGANMGRLQQSLQHHPWNVPSGVRVEMRAGKIMCSPREGRDGSVPACSKPFVRRPTSASAVVGERQRAAAARSGTAHDSHTCSSVVPPLPLVPPLPPLSARAARNPPHAAAATHGSPGQWGANAPRGGEMGPSNQAHVSHPSPLEKEVHWHQGRSQSARYNNEVAEREALPMNVITTEDPHDIAWADQRINQHTSQSASESKQMSPPRFPMRRALSNHLGPSFGHTVRKNTIRD